ncbi:penicillin-binding protein activator [Primorskyibacter flagellatus]|uniref:Penicillin-binding protein activator n=1 Tax=Primorskyibacter flagellatus TaxID=1387277 RepID=A0A916ZXF0_9RHOB|nr:penicillin-binding protein activator [Primorskyibacter flagellatus]GGE17858.1 penicillin-binding protein activator [Primorskyibacter flagellatus]
MFALLRKTRKAGTLLAAVASLTLAACEPISLGNTTAGGPSVDPGAPVPVALLIPKSGGGGDSFVSASLENAARLAIAELNGARIDLRVYDTAGNEAQATAVATKAINDGAKIILGPLYGGNTNAAGHVAAASGVNVLAFTNNASLAGGNVFVLGHTFENTAQRLVSYAARQGKRRIVTVSAQNAAGELGRTAIASAAASSGASVVGNVTYSYSQQGVNAAVGEVASTVSATQADAVFLTSNTDAALPFFAQLLPERGVDPAVTQYIGLTRWDVPPQTLDLPGLQGGWFALPDPTLAAQFNSRYSAAYGSQPHPLAGLAYDGIAAIGALVKQGKANALTAAALTQGAGFQGVNGVFRFRPNGVVERGLAVATIRNRQVVVVDPAPRGFGGFGF